MANAWMQIKWTTLSIQIQSVKISNLMYMWRNTIQWQCYNFILQWFYQWYHMFLKIGSYKSTFAIKFCPYHLSQMVLKTWINTRHDKLMRGSPWTIGVIGILKGIVRRGRQQCRQNIAFCIATVRQAMQQSLRRLCRRTEGSKCELCLRTMSP